MRSLKFALAAIAASAVLGADPAQSADPVKIRMSWVAPVSNWASILLEKQDLAKHIGKSYTVESIRFAGTPLMITAIANGELEMYYQPLVNLERNEVVGCEALVRWNHPQRGLVSPAEFIPIAEETGMIVPIGDWALRTACAAAASWPDHVKVAVNISPVQFKNATLALTVTGALAASGLSARRLRQHR